MQKLTNNQNAECTCKYVVGGIQPQKGHLYPPSRLRDHRRRWRCEDCKSQRFERAEVYFRYGRIPELVTHSICGPLHKIKPVDIPDWRGDELMPPPN